MLQIKNIKKEYKTGTLVQKALDGVSLSFRENEFVAILGPSGSGKTTLLNIVGGLDHADSGELIINGIPTDRYNTRDWDAYRNHSIGFVFQSYNLIPHQTLQKNVELSLTLAGVGKEEREERSAKELEKVGLAGQKDKKPGQLSGGQRQRVAMGRAIVRKPKVFLFDEPLSNLDAKFRSATRREILLLHKRLDATMLYVTHDQTEALTLADRIVCMSMGHVQQIGTPLELYDDPANIFVATFIGLPPMNLFEVRVESGKAYNNEICVDLTAEEKERLAGYDGRDVIMGVRPEDIAEGGKIMVDVISNENLGHNTLVNGSAGGHKITCKFRRWCSYKTGDSVNVTFRKKHFFDKDTTAAIKG